MWLVADIGGTKTVLGVYDPNGHQLVATVRYENNLYLDVESIIQEFLITVSIPADSIQKSLFAVAGLVQTNSTGTQFVQLTNRSWYVSQTSLQRLFSCSTIELWNDFYVVMAACARWAKQMAQGDICNEVFALTPKNLPEWPAPVVAIGAGTGLGQAFALPASFTHATFAQTQEDTISIVPTEGGHIDFAPRTPIEIELLQWLQKLQNGYVSFGHILSGSGIEKLYQFFQERSLQKPHFEIEQALKKKELHPQKDLSAPLSAIISSLALQKKDVVCQQALDCFVQIYASYASNVAVQLSPLAGLFLAGGIARKILPALQSELFLQRFWDRQPFRELCEHIPVFVVVEENPTLWGAIALLRQS